MTGAGWVGFAVLKVSQDGMGQFHSDECHLGITTSAFRTRLDGPRKAVDFPIPVSMEESCQP